MSLDELDRAILAATDPLELRRLRHARRQIVRCQRGKRRAAARVSR